MDVTHGMADIEPGLRLHYVDRGDGPAHDRAAARLPADVVAVAAVIPPLVDAGFRVVAPDYRGAGQSWRPVAGYDKRTMAGDIRRLLREHLGVEGPVVVVGHDIGLMVAFAYAQAYRDEVSQLVVVDAPLPGTEVFDRLRSDPRVWHFAFHGARDVAEMLVAGRERPYLQAFFNARSYDTSRSPTRTSTSTSPPTRRRARCARASSSTAPSTRTRPTTARRSSATASSRCRCSRWAARSARPGALVEEMMREVADDVTGVRIPAPPTGSPRRTRGRSPGPCSSSCLSL